MAFDELLATLEKTATDDAVNTLLIATASLLACTPGALEAAMLETTTGLELPVATSDGSIRAPPQAVK
jgi:hypothetical protein